MWPIAQLSCYLFIVTLGSILKAEYLFNFLLFIIYLFYIFIFVRYQVLV